MRLSKIAGLCKQRRVISLLNCNGKNGEMTQWLGDGDGMYLLTGLPVVDTHNVCTMFDLTDKQLEKIAICPSYDTGGLSYADSIADEFQIQSEYTICYDICGATLLPLMTGDGIVFINRRYLEPVSDDITSLTFWERHDCNGELYIAVKVGMFLQAVLKPDDANYSDMARELSNVAEACRKKAEKCALT